MLFNSAAFLLFFPLVTLLYHMVPRAVKPFWLLAASYFFYMCWNAEYALLLFAVTAITYFCGLGLAKLRSAALPDKKKTAARRAVLAGGVVFDLAILFFFKYFGFAAGLAQWIGSLFGVALSIPVFDVVLPVGISFYTFQAIGYTVDVYRGTVYAEKNFFHYALFVSFFPQLVAGPIERSGRLLRQLSEPKPYRHEDARLGLLIMLWGYFLKLVLADRIAIFVNSAYGSYNGYSGSTLLLATFLFAVQIYCDFAGYSTIAVGAAKILGVTLSDNFDAPYLSSSVSLFWKRWHISLTSWFRDYLYIPLGGSRRGKLRKYLNLFLVFVLSGLWHGADITFVIWGAINGVYRVAGEATAPLRERFLRLLRIRRDSLPHRIVSMLFTFLLVDATWIFFRAEDVSAAIHVIHSILYRFDFGALVRRELLQCGLDVPNLILLFICLAALLVFDVLKRKGVPLPEKLSAAAFPVRCAATVGFIGFILLFGIWGPAFQANDFIYFQF